jgi:hypothetical protein
MASSTPVSTYVERKKKDRKWIDLYLKLLGGGDCYCCCRSANGATRPRKKWLRRRYRMKEAC